MFVNSCIIIITNIIITLVIIFIEGTSIYWDLDFFLRKAFPDLSSLK